MNAGKCVAYFRVSTKRQGDSGLGLEAQKSAVQRFLQGGTWNLLAEFTEIESGKLDRLSRNLGFLVSLQEAGVPFVCADNPTANELTIHLLSVLAQHERRVISERTKAALQAAKDRGVKLGNPNIKELRPDRREAANASRIRLADAFVADLNEIILDIQNLGISSLSGIASELNRRGIPTQRGGTWQATQVRRVLDRIGRTVTAPGTSYKSNKIQSVTNHRIGTIDAKDRAFRPLSTAAEGTWHAN